MAFGVKLDEIRIKAQADIPHIISCQETKIGEKIIVLYCTALVEIT